ncbi:hypothetical protein GMORB2_7288 [Geosmithia morbida]|uniref:Uncharacterized protein n=1 Tax=Geosmithia morbida TaxID=1094350 RepID=A0A9P5D389_9HYPO|nr:uncharacterized protein GMORB2_7288 [Geosmithia morbida]KAF4122296.1 hypothetical protein GMORB2_7288 [Geosmithia morbida]
MTPTPAHLDRVLYVPYHSHTTAHLPLYDITDEYRATVGDSPVGGSEFKLRLCVMRKPAWNTFDARVAFHVDVEADGSLLAVEERCLGIGHKVHVRLPSHPADETTIQATTPDGKDERQYSVQVTCPVPGRQRGRVTIQYPYFTLTRSDAGPASVAAPLQWQAYPIEKGALCYLLVDTRLHAAAGQETPADEAVRAIYHHAGMEDELPTRYSEGVLLLPRGQGGALDTLVTSSLLGLLRYDRSFARVAGRRQSAGRSKLSKVIRRVLGDGVRT